MSTEQHTFESFVFSAVKNVLTNKSKQYQIYYKYVLDLVIIRVFYFQFREWRGIQV